jgi:hypothetical protein
MRTWVTASCLLVAAQAWGQAAYLETAVSTVGGEAKTSTTPGEALMASSYVYGFDNLGEVSVAVPAVAQARTEFGAMHIYAVGGFAIDFNSEGGSASAYDAGNALSRWGDRWRFSGNAGSWIPVTIDAHIDYSIGAGGEGAGREELLDAKFDFSFAGSYSIGDLKAAGVLNPTTGSYSGRIEIEKTFMVEAGSVYDLYGSASVQTPLGYYGDCPVGGGCYGQLALYAYNTAAIDAVFLPGGYSVTSESGQLKDMGGFYGYVSPVDEPATLPLVAAGFLGLLMRFRRDTTRRAAEARARQ